MLSRDRPFRSAVRPLAEENRVEVEVRRATTHPTQAQIRQQLLEGQTAAPTHLVGGSGEFVVRRQQLERFEAPLVGDNAFEVLRIGVVCEGESAVIVGEHTIGRRRGEIALDERVCTRGGRVDVIETGSIHAGEHRVEHLRRHRQSRWLRYGFGGVVAKNLVTKIDFYEIDHYR